jgi:KaiC/GvpD/RAD55 family RecA-like ATPase
MNNFTPKRLSEIRQISPPAWLVDGLLQANGIAVLYGPPGIGKSFLALDWALSICSENKWLGRNVSKGSVTYVVAEGAGATSDRIEAWLKERNGDEAKIENYFFAHDRAVDLIEENTVPNIITWGKKTKSKLIVFDTLARCAGIEDENDAVQMNKVINAVDRIRDETGASILFVHHRGKNRKGGARGSSALLAAVDTSISLDYYYGVRQLKVEKQRNAGEIKDLGLDLKEVSITDKKTSRVIMQIPLTSVDRSPGNSSSLDSVRKENFPKIDAIIKILTDTKIPLLANQIQKRMPVGTQATQKTVKGWLETGKIPGAVSKKFSRSRIGWIITNSPPRE